MAEVAGRCGSRLSDLAREFRRGLELGRQIAVDFKADADFEQRGGCPAARMLPSVIDGPAGKTVFPQSPI
jgi:hypothetical protein